jgi:hypothetical protein
MKFWTMVASLLVAGVVASGVYAQEEKKKGEGKKGGMRMTFKDLAGSDDAKLTEAKYVEARTKNVPDDKKEQATTRAKDMWKALAGDKKELTKDEYEAAMKKWLEDMKSKKGGGKKGGGKKGGDKKEA